MEKRLNLFKATVTAQNLLQPTTPSYSALYRRLTLTRRAIEFLITTLLIFGAQQFILANHFFSPLWPTAGVALAALFLRGNLPLFGIFCGIWISYWLSGIPWNINLIQCCLFTAYVYLLRALILKTLGAVAPLTSNAILWKLYALIILFSALHSWLFFIVMGNHAVSFWYLGWLGEVNGILCILPFCLIFDPFVLSRYFQRTVQLWWVLAIIIVICHLSYFIILTGMPAILLSLFFLIILCSYAKYFGQIPTCVTLLGIAIIYLGSPKIPQHFFHANASLWHDQVLLTLFTFTIMLSLSIATKAGETSPKAAAKN